MENIKYNFEDLVNFLTDNEIKEMKISFEINDIKTTCVVPVANFKSEMINSQNMLTMAIRELSNITLNELFNNPTKNNFVCQNCQNTNDEKCSKFCVKND